MRTAIQQQTVLSGGHRTSAGRRLEGATAVGSDQVCFGHAGHDHDHEEEHTPKEPLLRRIAMLPVRIGQWFAAFFGGFVKDMAILVRGAEAGHDDHDHEHDHGDHVH